VIMFLASVIEQLDLALDQIILKDANYSRFALMLTDNAVELTLHRFAEDREAENKLYSRFDKPRHDPKVVSEALGQKFDKKVKLARVSGLLTDEEAESINTLHSYRNQVYHRGLEHEPILSALALFYFRLASGMLAKYRPSGYGISSNDHIPHRARKYIGGKPLWGGKDIRDLFADAYARLMEVAEGIPFDLVGDLHRHMQTIIEDIDSSLDFLSRDGPDRMSRDKVVVEVQAWPFAFSDEGKAYAKEKAAQCKTVAEYAGWFVDNYPWAVRVDPIKAWLDRLASLKAEVDPHKALRKYHEFMSQTEELRERINEAAMHLDSHIQQQIDMARGK
jgi:hypothetical protein